MLIPSAVARTTFLQTYIGYNTIGASIEAVVTTGNHWDHFGKKVSVANAGLLASIDVYTRGNASNVQGIGSYILDDNANTPGKVIATSGGLQVMTSGGTMSMPLNVYMSTTPRWVSFPMGVWLSPGDYWLCLVLGGSNYADIYYDAGGNDYKFDNKDSGYAADAGVGTNNSRTYSIRGCLIY